MPYLLTVHSSVPKGW